MSNPLNRFHLSSKVENINSYDIDYIDDLNPLGDYKRIQDIDVIINSWNNILLTPRGSYDHDPQYGSGLFDLLFEPMCTDTEIQIKNEIFNSVYYYDDRATISDIKINTIKTGGYNVIIYVEYMGKTEQISLDITELAG